MERTVFSIWPEGKKPFSRSEDAALHEHFTPPNGDNIDRYTDVAEPVLSFFPACGKGPHPAVLVCPGGGYHHLAWSSEGLDIASFLNVNGISAFVLKYRCPDRRQAARSDAARAMRIIRANAEKFAVDPGKVGCIGFSAGAHLCGTITFPADGVPYENVDETDALPYRSDFSIFVYPAYLCDDALNLAPEFKITASVPPCLFIQTEDDFARVECSVGTFMALKRAGIKAEMHVYPEGGHGYGLLRNGNAVNDWGALAANWLRRQTGGR